MPPLSPDVQEFIDLTIDLVDLIYWVPDSVHTEHRELAGRSALSIPQDSGAVVDVEMGELGWRMHVEENNDRTI